MKTIQCLDCLQEFVGSNKEEVMNMMMPHYANCHKEIMENGNEEERGKWMEKFNNKWDSAEQM